MNISDWQKKWHETVTSTFPAPMTNEQRLLAVIRQVADASGALAKEKGDFVTESDKHNDSKHRIAAIFIDLLVLCEDKGVDLELEFNKALMWFDSKKSV